MDGKGKLTHRSTPILPWIGWYRTVLINKCVAASVTYVFIYWCAWGGRETHEYGSHRTTSGYQFSLQLCEFQKRISGLLAKYLFHRTISPVQLLLFKKRKLFLVPPSIQSSKLDVTRNWGGGKQIKIA